MSPSRSSNWSGEVFKFFYLIQTTVYAQNHIIRCFGTYKQNNNNKAFSHYVGSAT